MGAPVSKAKEQAQRQRRVAKLAAAELVAGGTFRVEEVEALNAVDAVDRLPSADKQWRSARALLAPGEPLTLDPGPLPPGTELSLVRPGQLRMPLEMWMTYQIVAMFLFVSVKTLQNLVSLHRLPRQVQWIGRGRRGRGRQRIVLLPPATCRRLAELTGRHYLIPRNGAE
jgi:hypothetical protein